MGKMKESSLFKWTQRKNSPSESSEQDSNNKEKKERPKKEVKSKKWLHRSECLTSSHISYLVKFLGSTEVDQPKGIEVVKEGIRKLKFIQQLKKYEGTKTPKVELTVSVDGLAIQDPKTKKVLHQYPLHRISYCADDKAEKKFFSFIAHHPDDVDHGAGGVHSCYVFVSDKLAEEITLTIGQAFDLSYNRFLLGRSAVPEGEKVARLERENKSLRERLVDMASMVDKDRLSEYMGKNNIIQLGHVEDEEATKDNSYNIMEESVDSAIDTRSCRLMSFMEPGAKLDTMTIDDLDDEDFDPRSSSTGNAVPSNNENAVDTPGLRNPRTMSMSTPIIKQPTDNLRSNLVGHLAKIVPPPSVSPVDPSRTSAAKAPSLNEVESCPFGMNDFDKGSAPHKVDFTLEELDPLRW